MVQFSVDTTTAETIQMCLDEYDPKMERTILVMTKVDLSVKNTEELAQAILFPTNHLSIPPENVIAVKNRSMDQIKEGVTCAEHLGIEEDFFQTKNLPSFGVLPQQVGVKMLSTRLASIQTERIRDTLPANIDKVKLELKELKKERGSLLVYPTQEYEDRLYAMLARIQENLEEQRLGRPGQQDGSDLVGESFEFDFEKPRIFELQGEEVVEPLKKNVLLGEDLTITCVYDVTSVKLSLSGEGALVVLGYGQHDSGWTQELSKGNIKGGEMWELEAEEDDEWEGMMQFSFRVVAVSSKPQDQCTCAIFYNLAQKFNSKVKREEHTLCSQTYMMQVREHVKKRVGGEGLPGTVGVDIPVTLVKDVLKKVFAHIYAFVDLIKAKMKAWLLKETKEVFAEHRGLYAAMILVINCTVDKQWQSLYAGVGLLREMENTVITLNHYYMSTVQAVREDMKSAPEDRPAYLRHAPRNVESLSNEDQNNWDTCTKVYAFSKVVRKRLVDNIVALVRVKLYSLDAESQVLASMKEAYRKEPVPFNKTMSIHESQKYVRETLDKKIAGFEKLLEEVHKSKFV